MQGTGTEERERFLCVGLRQVLVTSLTFSRLPRTRLGYIMVRPDCTLRSVCSLKIKCLKSFCTKPRLRGQSTSLRFWLRLHRLALFFCTARATSTSSGCLLICILKLHYKFVQQVLEPTFSFGLANFFSSIYLMLFLAASSQN